MIRTLIIVSTALLALCASAAAAPEQQHPRLKPQATVTGDLVRIGDLVEHAGIVAKVPIFRAPDLGSTGSVAAETVLEAVRAYALIGLDTSGIGEVVVTRASRTIEAKEIEERIAQALSAQYALGPARDIVVTFDRELRSIQVEPNAAGEPRVAHLNYDPRAGRFDVTLDLPTGVTARGALRLSGRAAATVEVAILARPVERGEVLRTADVLLERRPRAEIGRDVVGDREQAAGLAARNALQAGRPLRVLDLMKPEMIQRNETVTLVYEVPGITLSARGKAMEGGAEGDMISVLNEQSKRTVQGVVAAPGRVVISAASPRLAANIAPARSANSAR